MQFRSLFGLQLLKAFEQSPEANSLDIPRAV